MSGRGRLLAGAALTCALALLVPTAARATEKSEALTARGMVELNKGDTRAAIALFDQAIEADPEDAMALYQRGGAHAKEEKYAEAVPDLEKALKLRPDLDEAALELGIAQVELTHYDEARPWLRQAQRRADLDGQASFFLGIADLRQGDLDQARTELERARAKDPTVDTSSRYYLGVIEYRLGNRYAAREHFLAVQDESADSAVGRESAEFLDLIRAGEGARAQVYGAVTVEYDTNVVLAPTNGTPPGTISNQADGRVTLNAGGVYVPWRSERARLSVGYDFYQNLQFQLTEFNLQDHRPTVQFAYDFGPVRAGFLTQYDFFFLDASKFLSQVTAMPYAVIPETDIGRTELFARFEWLDYLQTSFDQLTGYDYSGGVRQVFNLDDQGRDVWVAYQCERMDTTQSKLYAYGANSVEVGLIWPLPWRSTAQVGYRFRVEEYNSATADAFLPVGNPRQDQEHRAGVAFRKDLNDLVSLVAAWIGTFNVSNKDAFQYNRQIGSLGVEVRY